MRYAVRYVDGYVLPIPRSKLQAYRRLAQKAGRLWRKHGALEYRECAGDDLKIKMGIPFPRLTKLKRGETAIFAWIGFRSRAHRNRVNGKVMKDPLVTGMNTKSMPFDPKRMTYGGFKVIVDA